MKHKVKFFLQGRENKSGKRPIYISFRSREDRLLCSTGQMIESRLWDVKRCRAKRGALLGGVVNGELDRLELATVTAFTELSRNGHVTPEALKAILFPEDSEPEEGTPEDLFAVYRLYLSEIGSARSKATIQIHHTVFNHLQSFVTAYKLNAELSQINSLFIEKFVQYLLTVVQLTNPSAEKIVRTFRAVLNWSNERGIATPDDFKRFTAKNFRHGQHSQKIYLNADDLRKIEDLDLTDNERLRKVRDVLLFQCWTGVRYGDLLKLRREHVTTNADGELTITLVTGKNRRAIQIPLLPTAERVWRMYEGALPKISNQRQNLYLKELCALAGIDTPCITVTYRGTQRIEKTFPKYELVGTHSLKRSFVTLLALSDVSLASIMRITGNSRATIETYIVATSQDAANEVRAKFAERS